MKHKSILQVIDRFLQRYFGFNTEDASSIRVINKNGKLIIKSTHSFKRHIETCEWSDFFHLNSSNMDPSCKENIGRMTGQAIADDLTVSFEPFSIIKNNPNSEEIK